MHGSEQGLCPPSVDGMAAAVFLVERYLPVSAVDDLPDSVARVSRLCAEAVAGQGPVEYVLSAYLPGDDTCFCVFRAESVEAVRAVNLAGRLPSTASPWGCCSSRDRADLRPRRYGTSRTQSASIAAPGRRTRVWVPLHASR